MPLLRGARLGKYEIIDSLGSGGMGDVYRALDPRLEREVAIKVIRSLSSNAEAQARLWREARAAASVSHPGVCQIYDVGESEDQLFIVMELLNGQSLASRLKDGAAQAGRGGDDVARDSRCARRSAQPADRAPRSETVERVPDRRRRQAARLRPRALAPVDRRRNRR